MADDITYQSAAPAGPPNNTKQVTDEHATRGHMPVVKLAVSADGDATLVDATAANGLEVDVTRVQGNVTVVDGGGSITVDGNIGVTGTVTVDSELPAAAALADNTANPTAPAVGAHILGWDGATWDRLPGDSANGLRVDLGTNNDVTVTSGSIGITGSVDTELPAAAALADNMANPTAPAVGAFGLLWDGATWDRAPGTSVDGALVNLGANNDVTVTGSVSVTGSVDTELPAAAALSDTDGNPTTPTTGSANMVWTGSAWARARGSTGDAAAATGMQNVLPMLFNGSTHDRLRGDTTNGLDVDVTRAVPPNSASATVTDDTTVTTTAENVASNTSRRGLSVMAAKANTSSCFIRFGGTASSTSYTAEIDPGGYYEMPDNIYTGAVSYVAGTGTQTLHITEW